ncbi:MAG TPA: ABC transporter ATP-binding protein [Lachnospiraceae bacterium]|nr:ABC transporter ATP-binding protein [Lachnospiraceae bacterium]
MSKKKEKDRYGISSVVKRMLKILVKEDKKLIGVVGVYTIAATIYPFFGVFLPKIAIGILEAGSEAASIQLVAAMGIYAILAGFFGWMMIAFSEKMDMRKIRIRMNYLAAQTEKLLTMDYKYCEDAKFFEENDKAFNAGNSNMDGIEGIYGKLFRIPAQVLGILGMLVVVGYLSPVILVCLILHVIVTMYVSRKNYKNEYATKDERGKANRRIDYFYKTTHDFSYGKDIRIYHLKDRIMKNYDAEIGALKSLVKRLKAKEYKYSFLSLFTLFLTNIVMYGILIYRAYQGMEISTFSMYLSAITSLLTALLMLGDTFTFLSDQGQYVADYFRMMDTSLVTEGGISTKPADTLEIVFDHVTFKYPGSEQNIFTDLCFTMHKGERLAIVGVNGAGKSTLVKLMTGLYEPTEGNIYINGSEIRTYAKKDLYAMFSAVFQDVNVLAFSIRENVTCTSDEVDEIRVREALSKVGLLEKIKGFDKGLNQVMLKVIDEDGTDFSGGERQKLSIARGLYKDANMVVMDEPTAALDALAEAEIYENFSTLIKGKTAVYISHRLASTKFCDRIALFDEDGLKEYGNHEELMAKKGQYYEMFMVQGKYYQEEAAI